MITDREKFLLRKEMDFHIHRYLMANSCQRLNGGEKAEHHIAISKILVGFITCDDAKQERSPVWKDVHDYLADILTDKMDEVIGFPIHTPLYGDMYTPLADKFFSVIIKHFVEIEQLVNSALANEA